MMDAMTTTTATAASSSSGVDGGGSSPPPLSNPSSEEEAERRIDEGGRSENDGGSSSSAAAPAATAATLRDGDEGRDGEDGEDDDDERASLLSTTPSNRVAPERRRRQIGGEGAVGRGPASSFFGSLLAPFRRSPSSSSAVARPFLLALALSLTLGTFWILDTLKDPTFAVLVDGDLERRQPTAKMVSVFGTLCVVAAVEYVDFARRKRRKRARKRREEEAAMKAAGMSSEDADAEAILSGGGRWTKMHVGDGGDEDDEDEYDDGGSRIHVTAFYAVGTAYAVAFGAMGYALSRHPSFSSSSSSSTDAISSPSSSSSSFGWRSLAYLLYATIESYGSIAVATFWSYANSTLSLTAAERHYGTIIAAAQLGAIGGSTIATEGSRKLGRVPRLFGVSCGGALAVSVVMGWYGRRFPRPMTEEEEERASGGGAQRKIEGVDSRLRRARGGGRRRRKPRRRRRPGTTIDGSRSSGKNAFLSGVYLILRHEYLLLILGVSCLYEVSLTCLDYEMKLIGLDRFPDVDVVDDVVGGGALAEAAAGGVVIGEGGTTAVATSSPSFLGMTTFARFMGRYGQITNALSLLLSYVVFPLLLERKGLRITLRIFPTLLLVATILAYLALPSNLPVLFVSMSLLKAVSYSINDPAKEILYMPTSDACKFKSKFWIDVVGARIAKAMGAAVNARAGSKERISRYATIPSILAAIALWIVCRKAGAMFERLVSTGEIVGEEDDDEEDERDGRRVKGGYDLLDGDVGADDGGIADYDDDDDGGTTDGWFSDTTIELVRHG